MTKIEWCHRPGTIPATWNPIVAWRWVEDPKTGERKRLRGWHCEHASTGCINCYSERQNIAGARGGTKLPFKPGHREDIEIELHGPTLLQPLHWKAPRTIFVCSMTDLYGEWVTDEMLDRIKAVQALTPQHTYIELTKRAERMREYLSSECAPFDCATAALTVGHHLPDGYSGWSINNWKPSVIRGCTQPKTWPLPNCWHGVSCERQQEADERIPSLMQTPAAVRFVSAEPLLEAICFTYLEWDRIDWIIVGGESGHNARPMNPQWARDIRDQCKATGVAFFHKQNGEYVSVSEVEGPGAHFKFPDGRTVRRVGKKRAGRLLDGREHNAFPVIEGRESQSGLSSPDKKQTEDASA